MGDFTVAQMENTEVRFEETTVRNKKVYRAIGPDGQELPDVKAGFECDGTFYPVTGWIAYSKQPYKDDLMAGVRVYCRGKIAAQTRIFNLKAGFTGEYDIRSYLIGELHADWLDEAEDLIRTDRQDILWSHQLGRAFEEWGQTVVKRIGTISREPRRKKAWQLFEEVSKIQERVLTAFPSDSQESIRENTLDIAKAIAQTGQGGRIARRQARRGTCQGQSLARPAHHPRQETPPAAEANDDPLSVITSILRTARIAELSAFGQIAEDRVSVIRKIERLKDDPQTLEAAFQSLISEAPWLINPQWSPLTANQSFTTLKSEFQKFYKKRTGKDLVLDAFADGSKRADFVMSSQDNVIEMIEIKKPAHSLEDAEMTRINTYVDLMEEFLNQSGNKEFKDLFSKFHVTLVCDGLSLKGVYKTAFDAHGRPRPAEPRQLEDFPASYSQDARGIPELGGKATQGCGEETNRSMKLTAVDLFAGGGGLTVGLKLAGFQVVAAVEIEKHAFATYKTNHPEVRAFRQDVSGITGEFLLSTSPTGQIDLLAGCPPCQGFSSLTSKYKRPDPRNNLIREMARLVEEVRPTAVMMENVPGLSREGTRAFRRVR